MAKFQTEVFEVKRRTKNEHLICDNVNPKRLPKFCTVYEFCLQCGIYARTCYTHVMCSLLRCCIAVVFGYMEMNIVSQIHKILFL